MNADHRTLDELACRALRGQAPDDDAAGREHIRLCRNLARLARLSSLFARGRNPLHDESDVPERWGHLRIECRIGEGAFGEVFRAHDTVLHRDVALKLQRIGADGEDGASYIDEARRLARVRHPNVLAIHGADIHGGRVGMWADLLRGQTLADRLGETDRLRRDAVLDLATQLAAAVAAVHGSHLCHGDIKPANVMWENDGRYVLMDFGAAREHSRGDQYHYGTPRFMSPERLRNQLPPSVADDLFAVGVILYRAALGCFPERVHADGCDPLPSGSSTTVDHPALRRAIGHPLARLIAQLLTVDPAARGNADALLKQCRRIADLPIRRRRQLWVAAIISSLAMGLVVALAGMWSAREAAKREAEERSRAEQVSAFLEDWLTAPRAEAHGRQVRIIDVLGDAERSLISRPPEQRRLRAELRLLVAQTLAGLGEFARAKNLTNLVLADYAESEAAESLARLRALSLLASIAEDEGEHDVAMQQRGSLLSLLENGPYRGGGLHLRTRLDQVDLLTTQGELDAAERELDALEPEIDELVDPIGGPQLRGLLQLSRLSLLNAQGNFEAAAELARETLHGAVQRYGERHSDVFVARGRLIEALALGGKLAQAEREARANLDAVRNWLGDEDRYALAALVALGNVLDDAGKSKEALHFRREASERAEKAQGLSPSDRAQARINLANSLKEAGERSEAIALYRRVIAGSNEQPIQPIAELIARSNLGEALLENGEYSAAATSASDCIARMQRVLGTEHPFIAHAQSILGAALVAQGNPEEGHHHLLAAWQLVGKTLGEENPLASDIAWHLAKAEIARGKIEVARQQLTTLLARQESLYPANHPDINRTKEALAAIAVK